MFIIWDGLFCEIFPVYGYRVNFMQPNDIWLSGEQLIIIDSGWALGICPEIQ